MLSIVWNNELRYPGHGEAFSPDQAYPEYRLGHLSQQRNSVYAAVRQTLAQAGLDKERFGTPDWNPFGNWVKPGQSVFVLCNFVYHRRAHETQEAFESKCTHASVIRPLIDYLLLAVGGSGRIRFGNAPLQGCKWETVLRETGAQEMLDFYQKNGSPVEAKDLRLFVAERSDWGWVGEVKRADEHGGVAIDLGSHSLLADFDEQSPRYRVLDYNPTRIESFHGPGKHLYVLNRAVLESDVVFSVPKLKTHEKVGMTCALKGCVGAIGHKDCLAHHRQGPPKKNGDEYPHDAGGILLSLSRMHDRVQQIEPATKRGRVIRVADRAIRKVFNKLVNGAGGAWWGNDTAWRMSLDIVRIVAHADRSSRLHDHIVRPHLVLLDGIVGGEGAGPLKSSAVNSGIVLFSDNPVEADYASAVLMGYAPEDLAIVREASRLKDYYLIEPETPLPIATVNGSPMSMEDIKAKVKYTYVPPPGWIGKL